ncbi:MAG: M23 family metallopeptidase [Rickettsiales bacterium]
MKYNWRILPLLLLMATHAYAEGPKIIRLGNEPEKKKFLPLQRENEKQNGVSITREKKAFLLKSDQQQLDSGSMRIDRAKTTPMPLQHALPAKSAAAIASPMFPPNTVQPKPNEAALADAEATKSVTAGLEKESDAIEGDTETIDPVLALYGGSDGIVGSFRDVLSGRGGNGLARHLIWPIPLNAKQYVSSGYGMRNDPFHGRPTFHGGIDIAADIGTPVLATADALVSQVTTDAGYGKYITLQHADGTLTRYGHLNAQNVTQGQAVKAGQVIGAVGSTGRSTGSHLDYRVSKNNVKYDPLSIISVPSSVPMRNASPTSVAATRPAVDILRGNAIASKPLPKRPMVIQVR